MYCRLPIELMEENIVDAVVQCGDVESLVNMTLVCRAVCHAIRPYLFRRVTINSPERCHRLLDFVQQNGTVRDGIRSLTMRQPHGWGLGYFLEAIPIPLLSLLRNLRQLRWLNDTYWSLSPISIHLKLLTWIRIHVPHIDTLHFERVMFMSANEFGRLLLAFPGLRNLRLAGVEVYKTGVLSETLKSRISASRCLRSLEIRSIQDPGILAAVFQACLDTLDTLEIGKIEGYFSNQACNGAAVVPLFTCISQIRQIVFQVYANSDDFTNEVVALQSLASANCTHLVIVVDKIWLTWGTHKHHKSLAGLHQAVLNCGAARTTYRARGGKQNEDAFWTWHLTHMFPSQVSRGQVDYDFLHEDVSGHPTLCGHVFARSVTAISTSSDGRWVATASEDTVILWTAWGRQVRHWLFTPRDNQVPEGTRIVSQLDLVIVYDFELIGDRLNFRSQTLDFSPYMISDGGLRLAVGGLCSSAILDLCDGKHLATITDLSWTDESYWLPDGRSVTFLATLPGLDDFTVQIWTEVNDIDKHYTLDRIITIGGLRDPLRSFFFSNHGNVLFSYETTGGYHIWNTTTRKEELALTKSYRDFHTSTGMVVAISPTPGPLCIATVNFNSCILTVRTQVARDAKEWVQETAELPLAKFPFYTYQLAFSGDGRTLTVCTVTEGWEVHALVYSIRTHPGTKAVATQGLQVEAMPLSAHCHWPFVKAPSEDHFLRHKPRRNWVVLSPRGTYIAYASMDIDDEEGVYIYCAGDGKLLVVFREPKRHRGVYNLMFSPDEELLVYSLWDSSVLIRHLRLFVTL